MTAPISPYSCNNVFSHLFIFTNIIGKNVFQHGSVIVICTIIIMIGFDLLRAISGKGKERKSLWCLDKF